MNVMEEIFEIRSCQLPWPTWGHITRNSSQLI